MSVRATPMVVGLCAAALLVVAGCCPSTPTAVPRGAEGETTRTPTVGARVSIVEAGFAPRTATIRVGDAVTWTNDDRVKHNVGGTGLVSGVLTPGTSYTHTFEQAGTYQYLCTFHPDTGGLVVVEPR